MPCSNHTQRQSNKKMLIGFCPLTLCTHCSGIQAINTVKSLNSVPVTRRLRQSRVGSANLAGFGPISQTEAIKILRHQSHSCESTPFASWLVKASEEHIEIQALFKRANFQPPSSVLSIFNRAQLFGYPTTIDPPSHCHSLVLSEKVAIN